MKLNRKNTALYLLEECQPFRCSTQDYNDSAKEAMKFLEQEFPPLRTLFRNNISYINSAFSGSYHIQRGKLDRATETIEGVGTCITHALGFHTKFFNIKGIKRGNSWDLEGTFVYFMNLPYYEYPLLSCIVHNKNHQLFKYSGEEVYDNEDSFMIMIEELLASLLYLKENQSKTSIIPIGGKIPRNRHAEFDLWNETPFSIKNIENG